MMKKIFIGFSAMALVIASVPMFAAFEAHVINVTAKIENALTVDTNAINFGTVFPQEHLNKPLTVSLSSSFLEEDRVDDIKYFIRQKPKCGITSENGTVLDHASTKTGHIIPGTGSEYTIDCGTAPRQMSTNETWGVLPSLCPYISKEDDNTPNNDSSLPSFHEPFTVSGGAVHYNDATGYLAKSAQDVSDTWNIDLAVPCFSGECAQDWASFVTGINNSANPNDYTQPKANEHKIFGCDLWVEVTGVSLPGILCNEQVDLMLVNDRSGSIGSSITDLKTAATAFVDILTPSVAGNHIGENSFSDTGTLDQILTGDGNLVKTAINALVSSGRTRLVDGISQATAELSGANDRPAIPDYMVIITDGQPNEPPPDANAEAVALAAATAAKAAGIKIFVVGVGAQVDPAYLKTIASGDDHYFAAADYANLELQLSNLAQCTE